MPRSTPRATIRPTLVLAFGILLFWPLRALASPIIDTSVSVDGSGTRTTAAFSTSTSGELLVAFVGSDGPGFGSQSVTVSGAGLTWTLVRRANAQHGTAEIWQASAASRLSNVTVTSRPASSGYNQSLTVVAFTGAGGIGASTTRSASSGAPSATVTTTRANSWAFGVGNDWDRGVGRTLASGQTMVHQYVDTAAGSTAWVQRMNAVTPASGTNVSISDTGPTTDRFNMSACEVLSAVVDTTAPTITAVSPTSGATGVAVTSKVTATFSEAMNAATITSSTFVLQAGATAIAATVAYSSTTHVATLTPSATLGSQTTYTATVKSGSTGVKDAAGNALAVNMVWSFTTADTAPPTVTSIAPASGATGVPANTVVTATFSEAMTSSTITSSSFTLQRGTTSVAATVAYNAATHVATLTPTAVLADSATFTATVKGGSTGVKDAAGNALATNVQWSFTILDTTAPTITSVSPASGATGVAATANVTATFSEAVDATTITASSFFLQNGGTTVAATLAYSATTHVATLTPSASLASLTSYTATVKGGPSGVKDTSGNSLVADVQWSFTSADTVPPTITAVSPASGATGVSGATTVTATFSEAMSAPTITSSTFTLRNGATQIPASVGYDTTAHVATLTPTSVLAGGASYTATVKGGSSGAKDSSGNALAVDVQWTFSVPDTTPPVITAVTPLSGASDVLLTATVSATFNEAMDATTITGSSFFLQTGGSSVDANVAYDAATGVVTLTPSGPLSASTSYTATVAGGAGGATDVAGNPLASDVVWSFSTPAPDTTAPTITTTAPSGSGVPITSIVTAIFSENVDAATFTPSNFFLQAGDTAIAATIGYSAATWTATLTPGAPLALQTTYTATIKGGPGGVSDLAGNPLAADTAWSFTTAADSTPPVLLTKTPAPGATGIPATAVVTASFSEALDPLSVNANAFELKTSTGTLIGATVTYDAVTNVVSLVPSSVLASSTGYTATVNGGAGGITDLAGNPITASVVWSFTTSGTPAAGPEVSVVPTTVRQTLEGLGGDYAFGQSDSAIGQFMLEHLRPAHARVQMFLPEWEPVNDDSDSQTFNWAAFQDVGYTHINFLQMQDFQRRGMGITISIWNAPNWMVQNPGNTSQRIIPTSMYGEAIESMAAYLVYARDHYGVTVQYMSFNEPDGGYDTQFSAASMNTFIKQASARFAALGLTTKWLAGDTADPTGVVSYASTLLQDATTRQYLGPISVHTWNSTGLSDSTFTSIYNLATQYGRPVWIEELGLDPGQSDNASYTTTYTYALGLANLYQRMVTLLHPTVVDYWEYGDDFDLADPNTLTPYPAYYAIRPLTDYLVPGTDVVNVTSGNANIVALAGKNDARGSFIVYAINNGTFAQTVTFTGLPSTVMTLLRTSAKENMVTVGSYNAATGSLTLVLPAQSVNALVAGDPASAFPEVTQ